MSSPNSQNDVFVSPHAHNADGPAIVFRSKPSDSKVIMRCIGSTAIVLVAFTLFYRAGQSVLGLAETTSFLTAMVGIALYVVVAFTLRENRKGQDFGWVDGYCVDLDRFSSKQRQFIATSQIVFGPGRFVACSLLEACIFMDFLQQSASPRDPLASLTPPTPSASAATEPVVESPTDWDADEESTEGLASARFLNMYKQQQAAESDAVATTE